MSGANPVPVEVVQTVRRFVAAHRDNAAKYDNAVFAIDSSGIYDLQELAASVYALGFQAGRFVGMELERSTRETTQ